MILHESLQCSDCNPPNLNVPPETLKEAMAILVAHPRTLGPQTGCWMALTILLQVIVVNIVVVEDGEEDEAMVDGDEVVDTHLRKGIGPVLILRELYSWIHWILVDFCSFLGNTSQSLNLLQASILG